MTRPPFAHDADLTHPWAARYRIPIIRDPYPSWSYEVALCVSTNPDPGQVDFYGAVLPNEDEAKVIGSVIDFRRSYYYDHWAQRMLTRPLDVEGGTNTLILGKITPGEFRTVEGWRYRLASWDAQVWSQQGQPGTVAGLRSLLDAHFRDSARWVEWKRAHADLFPAAVSS